MSMSHFELKIIAVQVTILNECMTVHFTFFCTFVKLGINYL